MGTLSLALDINQVMFLQVLLCVVTPHLTQGYTLLPYQLPYSPLAPITYTWPRAPITYYHPTSLQYYTGPTTRVVCSVCNCDNDFFCGYNCEKCSTPDFCSSCTCTTSLGCSQKCSKCSPDQAETPSDPPSSSDTDDDCKTVGGPAAGKKCIFPFTFQGKEYDGCAPLYDGIVNLYSSTTWCSTKVDLNGYHVRGPFGTPGKHVGFCNDACPKATNI